MVQGYYTLEEAARILGMRTEDLNELREAHEVRAFADRGTWRFRTQDIEELARRRGMGSNPDLPLGEAPRPQPHDSPSPRKEKVDEQGVFNFSLESDDQVEIGQVLSSESVGASKGSKGGSKSTGPKSPPPKPGSDSDVRLVSDGSDVSFQLASDSDVKVVDDAGPRSGAKKRTGSAKGDSGAKLVPLEPGSDSDVKIIPDSTPDRDVAALGAPPKKGSDSDVRLEKSSPIERADDSFLTEEIDLDAEIRKAEQAAAAKSKPRAKPRSSPDTEPLLSGPEIDLAKEAKKRQTVESSSDFDLSLEPRDESPIELSSGELKALGGKDEEVSLGELPSGISGTSSSDSGINLQEPADSGISLEQGGDGSDEIEFEISLDAESTPKPAKAAPNVDSSSEFELTLEDSGRLAPIEEETAAVAAQEKDIFETDFDVPALDESGSQAVPLEESDTDLESSDFDLALGDEDMVTEEESGSQVVALEDEESVDEGAATVARPSARLRAPRDEAEESAEDLLGEEGLAEEEAAPRRRAVAVAAAPADWGIFTPVCLLLTVIVMFLVTLMSFELMHGMWNYHQPSKVSGMVVRAISGIFYDQKQLPTD